MIDLHVHTCYSSDGRHTPVEILAMARAKGIQAIAFTDHNEAGANREGARLAGGYGIRYVSGVEFNSYQDGRDIHVLAYFLDYECEFLTAFLAHIREKKDDQAVQRCERLLELGFKIRLEDLREVSAGRPPTGVSFLKAMLMLSENRSDERLQPYLAGEKSRSPFMHFYNDFFSRPDCPAFVAIKDVPTAEVMSAIINCRGVPVIAHPKDLGPDEIARFKSMGARGIEVFTSYHDRERSAYYAGIAGRQGLVMTAGSDFHGEEIKKDVRLGETGCDREGILEGLEKTYRDMYGTDPDRL